MPRRAPPAPHLIRWPRRTRGVPRWAEGSRGTTSPWLTRAGRISILHPASANGPATRPMRGRGHRERGRCGALGAEPPAPYSLVQTRRNPAAGAWLPPLLAGVRVLSNAEPQLGPANPACFAPSTACEGAGPGGPTGEAGAGLSHLLATPVGQDASCRPGAVGPDTPPLLERTVLSAHPLGKGTLR
jgi:hypothetical protein